MKITLVLLLLFPLVAHAQDCGDFAFSASYTSILANYQCEVSLFDHCDSFLLQIIIRDGGLPAVSTTERIHLEQAIAFVKKIERIPTAEWNDLPNAYLCDGLLLDYSYISRQGYSYFGTLHLPVVKWEQVFAVEEEMRAIHTFQRLFLPFFTEQERRCFEEKIVPFISL